MQNGIAHNGLMLLWRMREGKHLCPGKTTLSDHAVLYLPVPTSVGMAQNNADRLVIDGGRATGKTILNLVNAGNSASGLATSGKGIQVVEAINGATTEEGAFVQGNKLQAGAFNYSLNRDSDESWYLRSENAYRAEVPLYRTYHGNGQRLVVLAVTPDQGRW